jgi:putative thioredoxin
MSSLGKFTLGATSADSPMTENEVVKDTATRNFMKDVVEASLSVPVIVDFWAPWCGPCKQLMPLLEKAVRSHNGKVRLVKVNIDENPEIAQQLRIQSVPMVYAFFKGQPVDGFAGMIPESQVKSFVSRLAGGATGEPDIATLLKQGLEAVEHKRTDEAIACFEAVLEQDPESAPALAGLIRCYVQLREFEAADALLENVPDALKQSEHITGAAKALELARKSSGQSGEIETLRGKLAENPKDYQTAFQLADLLFGQDEAEEAFSLLLGIASDNLEWNEGAARKKLLELFEVLGNSHPLTIRFRKRLSSLLFA